MPKKPWKRSGPSGRQGDLALQIVVGIIVVLAALLVGGLLSTMFQP